MCIENLILNFCILHLGFYDWALTRRIYVICDFDLPQKHVTSFLLTQDPDIRPLVELDSESLQRLLPEIPLWVKCPDYDRVSSWLFH